MSRPSPPVLTVRYDGSTRTFAPGNDVVVGRDLRADVRIAHPLISRAHLVLRFDQGRWVAIDNGSLNGMYANGRRVPAVDIHDGLQVNIGNPDGPGLTFEVGRHQGSAGTPPQTTSVPVASRPSTSWPTQPPPPPPTSRPPGAPHQQSMYPSGPQPRYPSGPQAYPSGPSSYPPSTSQPVRPTPVSQSISSPGLESVTALGPTAAPRSSEGNLATSMLKILRPGRTPDVPAGAIKIGRATDNDIVIPDVLASRHHATLVPTPGGTEILDNRSINGTFVNGARVESAVLHDGDTVTIGNVDLVFRGGTLVRRTETEAATRTGGLDVHGVTWTIEGNKTLLDNISMAARPGTLTAVIGPSGAGKSTFARLVAGYTHPTTGTVSFEGHDIHAEYASLRSRIGMVPQDDVVHGQLTVNQALMYAAELRLPPDTTKADRAQVVAQVLEELEMTRHADTRVDKLSGGQRKRASVAMELLTGPSLLILDEPTSGLDPALDRQVMTMLRQLADAGRVVLVVTHSLTYLDVCDQVLLLAPGGKTAFYGPPNQIGPSMGTTNWADIFSSVAGDPDAANKRFLAQHGPPPPQPPAQKPADLGKSDAHQPAPAILDDRASPDAADRVRSRLLHLPGAAAVHHGCAVAVGARKRRVRRTRSCDTGWRGAQRARADPRAAQRRRHLHGYRADDPRPHRRAGDLPARASRRVVHDRLHVGQGLRLRRVRVDAVGDRRRHQRVGQEVGPGSRYQRRGDPQLGPWSCTSTSRPAVWPRRWSAWRSRRWPNRTSRSCRCW